MRFNFDTVAVTVADDDGGSATATFHVTVTSPPPAGLGCYPAASPVITGISRATTTGTGTATTGDPTLVLSGTGEPGSTLTINRQGVGAVGTTVVGADGTWRFDYTGTALAAGSYTFTTDQAPFGPLGVAETFNGFVIQDVSGIPDAEGRLAAGGNVTLSNFSVGQLLSSSNGMRDDLIAGGSLNLTGGTVYKGNAVYGTTRSVSSSTTLSQGAVRKESVINFAAADTYLRGRADAWAALAATGTTTYTATGSTWAVALSGSNPTFNVFAVDGTKLSACSGFTITAPAGSTVLVNVSGTSGSVKNFAFTLAGVDKQHVLFNFAQYTSLTIASVGVAGSVLAPRAAVTFTSGSIDGTLVAKSLTGGGELHHFPLLSSCPVASSAPFVVTVQSPVSAPTAKFFVVGAGQGGRYSDTGAYQGANPLANTSGTPVGIAANSGGTATWVAVANADGTTDVWGYDRDGSLRTRWRAYGVTDARDVATDGTDVWVVGKDSATNAPKVFRYTKGASVCCRPTQSIRSGCLSFRPTQ